MDQPAPPSTARAPAAPFIVTAELPGDVFAWSDALRREHFPPERNKLAAHVTLFHAFAPSLRAELLGFLGGMAAEFAPPAASIEGIMNLGSGTAIALSSPGMLDIRAAIAEHFHGALTAQDQHPPRLHITIQNKVTAREAAALQRSLAPTIPAWRFAFPALAVHLYRQTHWEPQAKWSFRGKQGC